MSNQYITTNTNINDNDFEMVKKKSAKKHQKIENGNNINISKYSKKNDKESLCKKNINNDQSNVSPTKSCVCVIESNPDENPKEENELPLNTKWLIWIHPSESKDFSPMSYAKLTDINNVSSFWKFMNNFEKLDYKNNQFYLMRQGIFPIWEDNHNRYGSTISYRYDISQKICMDFWIDICMLAVNEILYDDMNDITGLSFTTKNNWVMIKVWNSNGNVDISKKLSDILTKKYPNQQPFHKKNNPEY
jgi:hypothetical protein